MDSNILGFFVPVLPLCVIHPRTHAPAFQSIQSVSIRVEYALWYSFSSSFLCLLYAYAMGIFILFINALRTLGAHRWIGNGEEMTFVQQLLDSVNYPDRPLTGGLWAPVGLRYHALHHIFPTMPYHALATAHRRLMRDLPAGSPYRKTEASSLGSVLRLLWKRARATGLNNQTASAT